MARASHVCRHNANLPMSGDGICALKRHKANLGHADCKPCLRCEGPIPNPQAAAPAAPAPATLAGQAEAAAPSKNSTGADGPRRSPAAAGRATEAPPPQASPPAGGETPSAPVFSRKAIVAEGLGPGEVRVLPDPAEVPTWPPAPVDPPAPAKAAAAPCLNCGRPARNPVLYLRLSITLATTPQAAGHGPRATWPLCCHECAQPYVPLINSVASAASEILKGACDA